MKHCETVSDELLVETILNYGSMNDVRQGASSVIEGHVYNVIHTDDNFSFTTTTVDAVKECGFCK
jgi:hypothetical protein